MSEAKIPVPEAILEYDGFKNLKPNDLGLDGWKSQSIHQANIALVYWAIRCRTQSIKGMAPISSKYLEKVGGRKYLTYLDWLVRHSFILVDRQYVTGKKSRGYRCTPLPGENQLFTVRRADRLGRAINTGQMTYLEQLTHQQLMTLSFDEAKAASILQTLKPSAQFGASRLILEFQQKNFLPMESENTGRITSAVTLLNTPLRSALSWYGEEIISVDVCNSQALCLAALSGCPRFIELTQQGGLYGAIGAAVEFSDVSLAKQAFMAFAYGPICKRKARWLGHTEQGIKETFEISAIQIERRFKTLQQQGYSEPDRSQIENRIRQKRLKAEIRGRVNKYFEMKFPRVVALLNKLKSGSEKRAYRNAAYVLQRIEAKVIVADAFSSLIASGIPALTIHDSILTQPKYKGHVKEVIEDRMRAELSKLGGQAVRAATKTTTWTRPDEPILQSTLVLAPPLALPQGRHICSAF